MEWTAPIDVYCERVGAAFWAEPINAISNAAFVIAALWIYPRVRRTVPAQRLAVLLGLIGVGSFAFHTFADRWSMVADIVPIIVFAVAYLDLANRDYLGLSGMRRALALLAFFVFAAVFTPVMAQVPIIGVSAGYTALPAAMIFYGLLLRHSATATSRALLIAGGLLILSLLFRSVDMPLCTAWPRGTHFMWHVLNAVLLAWLIHVYHAHMLVRGRGSR